MAYTKTVWTTGDLITAALLNHLEQQYDECGSTLIPAHAAVSSNVHGVGSGSVVVGTNTTQTLAGKTLAGFDCTAKGNYNVGSGRLVLPVGTDKYAT